MKVTAVILVVALAGAAYGFPAVGVPHEGAPHPEVPKEAICDSMEVGHGWPAQNSPSPYTIALSNTKVAPGETITVTIASIDEKEPFRGLVVQGRCGDKPVGSFIESTLPEGSKYTDCGTGKQNAYTFITSDGNKYKDVLTWQAPQEPQDCSIVFYVSTVKTYNTYWVKQKSEQELEVSK
uniref:Putative defense protein 3 n=1 Tax=Lygus hesperus TaxID=30085 RepID=A0A146L3C7_LYGHE